MFCFFQTKILFYSFYPSLRNMSHGLGTLSFQKKGYTFKHKVVCVCVYRKRKEEKNYIRGMFRDLRYSFRPSSSWIETLLRRSSINIHFHFGKTQSSSVNIDSGKFYYYFIYFFCCVSFFFSYHSIFNVFHLFIFLSRLFLDGILMEK